MHGWIQDLLSGAAQTMGGHGPGMDEHLGPSEDTRELGREQVNKVGEEGPSCCHHCPQVAYCLGLP